jgi:hypothetical protein
MTGGKALPTFLQSSPYLSNPTRDGTTLSKSESQEAPINQGRRTTKFADVVAIISSNKSKLSSDNNASNSIPVQDSQLSSILEGVQKTRKTSQESQDREGVIPQQQQQPRNISTAVSMKSTIASPGSLDSNAMSTKHHNNAPQAISTTTLSSMTDRQKRLLTRTILHPDEIDMIFHSFKITPPDSKTVKDMESTADEGCGDDISCKIVGDSPALEKDHEDDLSISSTEMKTWLNGF